MKRLLILVEGQTEETFVRDVLAPHLRAHSVSATPKILATKRMKAGGQFRGGVVSSDQLLREIRLLLGGAGDGAVTSIVDYYGLPSDVPGMASRPIGDAFMRVAHVERELAAEVDDRRFIPHVALHEFETWLFANPTACEREIGYSGLSRALESVQRNAGGPELVNDGPDTAPSKRLLQLCPAYDKAFHGPLALAAIGLEAVRQCCPHFAAWLARLEGLRPTTATDQ